MRLWPDAGRLHGPYRLDRGILHLKVDLSGCVSHLYSGPDCLAMALWLGVAVV